MPGLKLNAEVEKRLVSLLVDAMRTTKSGYFTDLSPFQWETKEILEGLFGPGLPQVTTLKRGTLRAVLDQVTPEQLHKRLVAVGVLVEKTYDQLAGKAVPQSRESIKRRQEVFAERVRKVMASVAGTGERATLAPVLFSRRSGLVPASSEQPQSPSVTSLKHSGRNVR